MKTAHLVRLLLVGIVSSAALSAQASSNVFPNGQSIFGERAKATASSKIVDTDATKHLRVAYGETVVFRDKQGQEFAWTFDGFDSRAVDVSEIAPAGFQAANTRVYVEQSFFND
jgi:hypothetical protein